MLVPGDINPILTIPVSELSWKSLNVSSNSSNPDNDNTSVSQKFLDNGALQLSVFFRKVFCHK